MKEQTPAFRAMELFLNIEERSALPFYRRLSDALKEAIFEGRLKPGDELPSVRALADRFAVSRVTVLRAYSELQNQGYTEAVRGSATRVSLRMQRGDISVAPEVIPHAVPQTPFTQALNSIASEMDLDADSFPQLNFGIPTPDLLPIANWRRLLSEHCSGANPDILRYQSDPRGLLCLREVLVDYLARSRGVRCDADQIFVFAGLQHALHMLCRLIAQPGDRVAIENPGHVAARRVFQLQSLDLFPVAVDADGLIVSQLSGSTLPIKAVYATPSHQFPRGCALSLERRIALLSWAHESGAFIVENDNDAEFRYGRQPLPALQGLDRGDCVIYIQTFWKTLGPMVRMGFAVVPKRLVEPFVHAKSIIEPDFPALEQSVLAEFIESGLYERHIAQMRKTYSHRRQALVRALTEAFGARIQISKETAGTFAIVNFDRDIPGDTILNAAARANFPIASSAPFYLASCKSLPREFLVPFAHRLDADIEASTHLFAKYLNT